MLERSLISYEKQTEKDFEIIAISDDCTDGTYEMLRAWQKKLDIKIITLSKEPGKWRDCSSIINLGISMSRGRVCILTQPEVIPGLDVVKIAAQTEDWQWIGFKPYWLQQEIQDKIDLYPWREFGPIAFRQHPGFYDLPSVNVTEEYAHRSMENHSIWQSWTIGAMTRKTLFEIGGLQEYELWGTVDVDFMHRRAILEIPTITPMEDSALCAHQWHESPRHMEASMAILKTYNTREEAILCNL